VFDIEEPALVRISSATQLGDILPGAVLKVAIRRRNLLADGRVLRILRRGGDDDGGCQEAKACYADHLTKFLSFVH
jgi:hypothetical protein